MRPSSLNRSDYYLLISFLSLFAPLLLFVFRSADDNRLTSWRWVFGELGSSGFFFLLVAGLVLSLSFCRLPRPGRPSVFLFVLSFLSASFFWGEPEVIIDAARYFTQAKNLELYGSGYFWEHWGGDIFAWTDLPLIPLLYGLIFKYLGESRIYIQLFTTTLFALTTVITYQLGKELWDEEVGFWGGFLLLGFPYLYTQVPLMLVDVPTMFFLTLSVLVFTKTLARGGFFWIIFTALALLLAVLSKYSTWLLLSVHLLVVLNFLGRAPGPTVKRTGQVLFFFVLFAGLVLWNKHEIILEQVRFIAEYQKPGLQRWGESFVSTFLFQIHPFITGAAIYSVYAACRKKDLKYLIIVYLVLLIILLQIKRIRYALPVFPMLALMASFGLREIKDPEIRKYIALCAVNGSLVIALGGYLPCLQGMGEVNLKDAGRLLNSIPAESARLVTLASPDQLVNPAMSAPLLDLYTDKRILYSAQPVSAERLARARESSLRFTWEYSTPSYYKEAVEEDRGDAALVVVTSEKDQQFPEDLLKDVQKYGFGAQFHKTSPVFQHQAFVMVFYN